MDFLLGLSGIKQFCLLNVHINWKGHSAIQTMKMSTKCASWDQGTLAAHRQGTPVTLKGQVALTSPQLSVPSVLPGHKDLLSY